MLASGNAARTLPPMRQYSRREIETMNANLRERAIRLAEADREDIEAAFVMFRMGLDRIANVVDGGTVTMLAATFCDAVDNAEAGLERGLDEAGAGGAVTLNLQSERAEWNRILEGDMT